MLSGFERGGRHLAVEMCREYDIDRIGLGKGEQAHGSRREWGRAVYRSRLA